MKLKGKQIGIALTGSFCTFDKIFAELERLVKEKPRITIIFSDVSSHLDTRFGRATQFLKQAEILTGKPPILSIPEAEPIGPGNLLDILVIFPCTGNTAAKLANGITDTPVLMAAKAHLRNSKPLVVSISTNDGLGMNMKNIGLLLNTKHVYFIPFGQDLPKKKTNSLIAHIELLIPTLEMALDGKQYQPVLKGF